MTSFQTLVESYVNKTYKKVQRSDCTYKDTMQFCSSELQRLLSMYKDYVDEDQTARLTRDSIEHHIRRYHDYSIRGDIGAHYRQTGIAKGDTVFEHVIPVKEIICMLLNGQLTIQQALHAPTCLIKKSDDVELRNRGLGASSPGRWYFFQRYKVLNSVFTTYNGQSIDLKNWTLADHYKFFNIV